MSHRSVSQLKLYSKCPELYRLERIEGEPQRPAAWTAVGSAFHCAYEDWELGLRSEPLRDLFTFHYNHEIASLKDVEPDLDRWVRTPRVKTTERDIELRGEGGAEQAEVYEEHCRMADWQLFCLPSGDLALEWEFTIRLGHIEVRGAVDALLVWPDGSVTIRDLKTGNRELDNRQLGVYKLAANELLGLSIDYGEYWYIKDGANREVDLRRYTREYLTDQMTALDRAINNKIWIANPGSHCQMCGAKAKCREMGWA